MTTPDTTHVGEDPYQIPNTQVVVNPDGSISLVGYAPDEATAVSGEDIPLSTPPGKGEIIEE
ncbi:hypothetical protein [Streptomyces malaysiensis]